ncbi:MAG TPA: glycosyltransferase family 2 protein [Polyangium sp.]|nr:glycosyltransferase family 2 protein [Polyangium sp.]
MTVSVILAAFNESGTIEQVVQGCREHTPNLHEIIVVDDGSHDDTAQLAKKAGARVIRLSRNGGKGVAIRRGIADASGDVLLFMDADGQDEPREIPLLINAFGPNIDMVVGSRFLGTFGEGAITPLNRLGNRALTEIVNVLFGARLTDTQAGFRAVRREAALRARLSARRYDIEVDLLLSVLRSGARVVEVPVTRLRRDHGQTHLDSFRDGTRILVRIVRKRFDL